MIDAEEFIQNSITSGFSFFVGVPCSFLSPLINGFITNKEGLYVGAASEGESVAIAAGAWLAGKKPIVMFQNSGLGNAVNPLTSLNAPFEIPALIITTWRGEPGLADEPQHRLMGEITHDLLRLIGVKLEAFPTTSEMLKPSFASASRAFDTGTSVGWVMKKGTVADTHLVQSEKVSPCAGHHELLIKGGDRPLRASALSAVLSAIPTNAAVIASTGKMGRELFTLLDQPQHFYQVGSMGCASGMALGVSLNTDKPVYVLDGDGAALMKLGTFATIGAYAPKNLVHILLDNEMHDSTGGQATVSSSVDFASISVACGYRFSASCDDLSGFQIALDRAKSIDGPSFIHLKISAGSLNSLGRPTISPQDVARRFRNFLLS